MRPEPGLSADETDDYQERAAILEYDAGLPRAAAEFLAKQLVIGKRGEGK